MGEVPVASLTAGNRTMARDEAGRQPRTPEEIQREIHDTQQRLSRTMEEIQNRLAPNRLKDQVMQMFRNDDHDGGSGMTDTVRDNALPLAMIGLGLGWLMWSATGNSSSSSSQSSGRLSRARDWTGGRIDEARQRMQHAGESLRRRAEEMRGSHDSSNLPDQRRTAYGDPYAAGTASRAGAYGQDYPGEYHYRPAGRADESSHGYGDAARDRARQYSGQARQYGRAASRQAKEGYQSFWHLVDDHPMLAGMMGFAAGAALGAAIPSSRYEDEWIGEYSDTVWDRGRHYGEDFAERAGDVARHAAEAGYEAARDTVSEEAPSVVGEGSESGNDRDRSREQGKNAAGR